MTQTDITTTNTQSAQTVQLKTLQLYLITHPDLLANRTGWLRILLFFKFVFTGCLTCSIDTYLFEFGCGFIYFCSVYTVLLYITIYTRQICL
jgi:hypothetical protein